MHRNWPHWFETEVGPGKSKQPRRSRCQSRSRRRGNIFCLVCFGCLLDSFLSSQEWNNKIRTHLWILQIFGYSHWKWALCRISGTDDLLGLLLLIFCSSIFCPPWNGTVFCFPFFQVLFSNAGQNIHLPKCLTRQTSMNLYCTNEVRDKTMQICWEAAYQSRY